MSYRSYPFSCIVLVVVALRPVKATEQEIVHARRKYEEEGVSAHAEFLLVCVVTTLSAVAFAWFTKWWFALCALGPLFQAYSEMRRKVALSRELDQMTTTYGLAPSELQIRYSYNGGKVTEQTSVLWRNVAGVEDQPDGVVVRQYDGTREFIPNACFASPEQRALVRFCWLDGRSLIRLMFRQTGAKRKVSGDATGA